MSRTIENKNVVISGGSGYLGSAIVKELINSGFTVISLDRTKIPTRQRNSAVRYIQTDITSARSVKKACNLISKKFGTVSTLIYSASAPLVRKGILDESVSDFKSQFDVNVMGAWNLFRACNVLLDTDSVIIGITSQAIEPSRPISSVGSYIPAKYALRGLLRVLSGELRQKRTRVLAIAPGFMPGGLNSDMPLQVMELLKNKMSKEDMVYPEEVASLVVGAIRNVSKYPNGKSVSIPGYMLTDL